jgi:hypothetical protein
VLKKSQQKYESSRQVLYLCKIWDAKKWIVTRVVVDRTVYDLKSTTIQVLISLFFISIDFCCVSIFRHIWVGAPDMFPRVILVWVAPKRHVGIVPGLALLKKYGLRASPTTWKK